MSRSRIVHLSSLEQFAAVNLLSDPGYLPGPVIIPNCVMVRINWNLADGKVGHQVLHGTYSGSPALSSTVAQSIFSSITTGGLWTALAAFLATTTSLASVTLLDLRSITATEFQSTGAAVPGTSAGTALPDEVAFVITLRTANRGPSGRGRTYIPGWASNATAAGGVVAATAVTAAQNWMASSVHTAISTTFGATVLALRERQGYTSPITGRVFPDRDATTVPLTNLVARDNHWDSQRRRGLK